MNDEQLVTFAFLRKRTPELVAIDTVGGKEKKSKKRGTDEKPWGLKRTTRYGKEQIR
jgi:hypothetical protein